MYRLRLVEAGQAQDLLGTQHVGRFEGLVGVDQVNYRAAVDNHVYLARQLVEVILRYAQQGLSEVADHWDDALCTPSWETIPLQVIVDGAHRIGVVSAFAGAHQAVNRRVRLREQRIEEECPQEAGRAGQEDT